MHQEATGDLAGRIVRAQANRLLLPPPESQGLDAAGAYGVQRRVTAARLAAGARIAGWKLGYTSAVMREQMGIDKPNLGPLTDAMILDDGAVITSGVTQPRVEPEIAAVLAKDLAFGPSGADTDAVRLASAVGSWHAALEIVDSVWQDYRFDWALNTADGSSAAFVVLGEPLAAPELATSSVTLRINDSVVATGTGGAAMGEIRGQPSPGWWSSSLSRGSG